MWPFLRSALALLLGITAAHAAQPDPPTQREARGRAEAMVRPSGPLRINSDQPYTPPQWRANRQLAGVFTDPAARHRLVEPTHAWQWPYGRYGITRAWSCRPYYGWHRCR